MTEDRVEVQDRRGPLFARVDFPFLDDPRIRTRMRHLGRSLKGSSVIATYVAVARHANFKSYPAEQGIPSGRHGFTSQGKMAGTARITVRVFRLALDWLVFGGYVHRGPRVRRRPMLLVLVDPQPLDRSNLT